MTDILIILLSDTAKSSKVYSTKAERTSSVLQVHGKFLYISTELILNYTHF